MSDVPGALHWRWEDPTWPVRVGEEPSRIVREALRRAVDIRDRHSDEPLAARPVFLVDVLNRLCEVLAVDTKDLWDLM
jgi:hypothetical protein